MLNKQQPGDGVITKLLAGILLSQASKNQRRPIIAEEIDENIVLDINDIQHREQPVEAMPTALSISLDSCTEPEKACILLDELRELHRKQPGESGITNQLAYGLTIAFRR